MNYLFTSSDVEESREEKPVERERQQTQTDEGGEENEVE